MTRMRFVLNDESKADVAGIEDLPSAKGSFTQSGQFQVIIGNDVKAFYEDFVAVSGIEGVTKDAAMAAHFVLGPIGWWLGSGVSAIVYAGITGPFRAIFGAIVGALYAPLVITGLHHMSKAIDLQLIADFGGTMLWPMIALSNIARGSAVLGMAFLQRSNDRDQQVNIPAIISCYLGVTEPAMFGVNLKYTFPFVCGMVGSCIAGLLSVATSCTANAVGVGGLPGILSMQPTSWAMFAVCMVIAVVVPFVLTVVVGKKKGIEDETRAGAAAIAAELASEGK